MPTAADLTALQAQLDALKAQVAAEPEQKAHPRDRLANVKKELEAYQAAPHRFNSAKTAEIHTDALATLVDIVLDEVSAEEPAPAAPAEAPQQQAAA